LVVGREAPVVNTMRAYVKRRMPLLWKLIIPLNNRGVMLDQVKHRQFQEERTEKKKTWRKRAERHWEKEGLGELRKVRISAGKFMNTRLPIGPKGGFSNKLLRNLLYEEMGFGHYRGQEGPQIFGEERQDGDRLLLEGELEAGRGADRTLCQAGQRREGEDAVRVGRR
jgi:hypothetical protein